MVRKTYTIENLGCANCAAKMEANMNALPQVEEAVIIFATRQLRVTAEDPDALLPQLQQIVSGIEADAVICTGESRQTHGCGCEAHGHHEHCCGESHVHHDHCHEEDYGGHCGHEEDHAHHHQGGEGGWKLLLVGAALFAFGLLLDGLGAALLGIPLSILAYLAAYLLLGAEVLTAAGKNLIKGHVFDENFLMGIATLGAFAIGEFPEAVGIMLFYRVGEYFEQKAVERSRSQIMEAVDLRPETVNRIAQGHIQTIPAGDARVGDLLLIRPGDRIPLDAVVVEGNSRIDTAPVTGEPVPISAGPGDPVISGCVNTQAQLIIQVEKPLSESMVTRILHAVENAAASKPKIDRFITRFARIYTPVVVAVAAVTAIVPSLVTGEWNYWVYTALSFLVMSCPCALVLSVPLAFFSGIGMGSKKGILFKGGVSMEAMARIRTVALDKTGTVTKGEFRVQKAEGPQWLLEVCASVEQNSTHPIAVSIVAAAKEQGLTLCSPEQMEEISGCGIRAELDGKTVLCGNTRLMERFGVTGGEPLPEQGGTAVLVAVDGSYAGYLLVDDAVKPGAATAVAKLTRMGIQTVMLTGDGPESAHAVAKAVGIGEVHSRLLPQEKLEVLQQLRSSRGEAMFVGDGINDAPVLAGADVGAAMGSGADAAIEAADVVYMTSDVQAIPESLILARRTGRIAWQNVIFALAVKAVVMILGLMGHASMWMAVFADSGVAMLCVLNSIRLLYAGKEK